MTRQEAGVKRRGKIESGSVFGKWVVLEEFMAKRRSCRCQCECGTIRVMPSSDLTRLDRPTRSCGCNGSTYSHGNARRGKKTREYRIWINMASRCSSETNPAWSNYGGRGIMVCERWRESFENFLEDMGLPPTPKHTLDRFPNNNGNYEPNNCRWATAKEQARNTRRNVVIDVNGTKKSLPDWCDHLGVSYTRAITRWCRGVRDPHVLFQDGNLPRGFSKIVEIDGEKDNIEGWCRKLGISRSTVSSRVRRGMSLKEAITVKKHPGIKTICVEL